MNYAPEKIVEMYYAYRIDPKLSLTLDYQHIQNPAYNADRGPVSIVGARIHVDF
jgi:high affinity Mn2+ porin